MQRMCHRCAWNHVLHFIWGFAPPCGWAALDLPCYCGTAGFGQFDRPAFTACHGLSTQVMLSKVAYLVGVAYEMGHCRQRKQSSSLFSRSACLLTDPHSHATRSAFQAATAQHFATPRRTTCKYNIREQRGPKTPH